jgi:glyoxylase-like metal-dependent hydrolase (beta-lactamase superfamily II)
MKPTMGQIVSFRPNIWLTEQSLREFDVRGVLLRGEQRGIVWDTLAHPRSMEGVTSVLGNIWLGVVYSHADWDHVWGTGALMPHAIIAHQVAAQRFSNDVPLTLRDKQLAEPGYWEHIRLLPPTITFSHTLTLDLGGATLELHALPGHTHDCIVGFVPQWGMLLAGDTVETPLPVIEADSPVQAWMTELARWAADARVQTVIPSHGDIGGREVIQRTLNYLRALWDGRPYTFDEVLDPFYEQTHHENLAHVEKMRHR